MPYNGGKKKCLTKKIQLFWGTSRAHGDRNLKFEPKLPYNIPRSHAKCIFLFEIPFIPFNKYISKTCQNILMILCIPISQKGDIF